MPVQGDAFVAKSATVEPAAQIAGKARILHHATVRGQASVYGHAVIAHHAKLSASTGQLGHIYVYGTAQIDGHATIGAGADIALRRHVLTITGLGPDGNTLTVYRKHPMRDEDGAWAWSCGVHLAGWYGTIAALHDRIEGDDVDTGLMWDGALLEELAIALDLAHERTIEWAEQRVTNEDRKRWQLRDSDLRRAGKRAEATARRAAGLPLPQPKPAATR